MRSLDSASPAEMTGPDSVREGIERLRMFFAEGESRQAILARQVLDQPTDEDESLARRLVDDLRAETRMDGSIGGEVVSTIWRAHELLDLGSAGDHAGTVRVLGWVLGLQNKPGAFSEGCSPPRHAHRACEHFISGFFSPAPAEQRFAPVMLPNGKVFRAEPAARFAVSCLALRAALRGRMERRPSVQQHYLSLVQLQEQWDDWDGYFAPDAIVAGIHALAFAPAEHRDLLPKLATMVAAHQADDGTWPQADLFQALEALHALHTREAHGAVQRAVPALLARQRIDGSFGSTAQQERALIALRALVWAEEGM
ncbi:MAG TPA: hypothetical protein VJ808_11270 [Gemmatimonadales bacterium]|nr:hypothetical protein [Gemmatimonadales bacterium]